MNGFTPSCWSARSKQWHDRFLFLFVSSTALLLPFLLGADPFDAGVPLFGLVLHSYVSIRLAHIIATRHTHLISLLWWFFFYWFFGVVALIQLSRSAFSEPPGVGVDQASATAALVTLFLVGFDISSHIAFRSARLKPRTVVPHDGMLLRRVAMRRFVTIAASMTYFVALIVGLSTVLLRSRNELGLALAQAGSGLLSGLGGGLILQTFFRVPILVAVLSMAYMRRTLGHWPIERRWVAVGIGALTRSIWPTSVPRYWLGTAALGLWFIIRPPTSPQARATLAMMLTVIFALVFPFADAFRRSVSTDSLVVELRGDNQSFWASRDWDAFQMTADAIRLRDEVGVSGGKNLFGAALFWVPRSMWPAKPEPTGRMVARAAGRRFERVSMPLVAEAYLAFGALGVLVGGGLIGLSVGRIEAMSGDTRTPTWMLHATVAAYMTFVLRGALMPAVAYGTPLIGMVWLVTRRMRQGGRSPTS